MPHSSFPRASACRARALRPPCPCWSNHRHASTCACRQPLTNSSPHLEVEHTIHVITSPSHHRWKISSLDFPISHRPHYALPPLCHTGSHCRCKHHLATYLMRCLLLEPLGPARCKLQHRRHTRRVVALCTPSRRAPPRCRPSPAILRPNHHANENHTDVLPLSESSTSSRTYNRTMVADFPSTPCTA
jgi:hypothetical protein